MADGRARAAFCASALSAVGAFAVGSTLSARAYAADASPTDASSGTGAPKTPVFVEPGTCAVAPHDDVVAVLRVELPAQLVESSPPAGAYHIAIDCSGAAVVLSVTAEGRANRAYRTALRGAPANVRPRIVALAIAEIVRELDGEAARAAAAERAAPAPAPAAVVVDITPPTPDVVPRVPHQNGPVYLGALGQATSFRLDGRWLLGGGLRFEYTREVLCAGIDAVLLTADERVSLGTAQVLLSYASPYVGLGGSTGPFQMRLGAGYALGAARLSGHATDPSAGAATVTGAWTAPYAFAQVALSVSDSLRLDVRGQAGWVTSTVVGEVEGGGDVNLAGLWTSVQIGAALSL
jgi:hypothetical protein